MKLVVGMLAKNEANRYLGRVLDSLNRFADRLIVLDDNSSDGTPEAIRDLSAIPTRVIAVSGDGLFGNEIVLRKQLYGLVQAAEPDWFMIVDADEVYHGATRERFELLMGSALVDVWGFRLYDMWDAVHYRDDELWRAHNFHLPMLVRQMPDFRPRWREQPHHCGRLPENVRELRPGQVEDVAILHYGWSSPDDRRQKYERYMRYDPDGRWGSLRQYASILDPEPHLVAYPAALSP